MTVLSRMAQVVRDLRELNAIMKNDKVTLNCLEENYTTITITNENGNKVQPHFGNIYMAFLKEFSKDGTIKKSELTASRVKFVIRDPVETEKEGV